MLVGSDTLPSCLDRRWLMILFLLTLACVVAILKIATVAGTVGHHQTFSTLDDAALHADRTVETMELIVETACVANGIPSLVSSPERCGCCPAVRADQGMAIHLVLVICRAPSTG